MPIKWPIPDHTQLELVALLALKTVDPSLRASGVAHSARVRVPGLKSRREVDVLFVDAPGGRRVSVEAQKRGRKVTQPFLDQVEGKMLQIAADRTVLISEAGFSEDVVTRVRNSKGRPRAMRISREELEVKGQVGEATLEFRLSDGAVARSELTPASIVDTTGTLLGHVFYGVCEQTRAMVVVTLDAETAEAGGTGAAIVMQADFLTLPITVAELVVSVRGMAVARHLLVNPRDYEIPTEQPAG